MKMCCPVCPEAVEIRTRAGQGKANAVLVEAKCRRERSAKKFGRISGYGGNIFSWSEQSDDVWDRNWTRS